MPFHAFISYSHAADGKLAPSLQTKLERFATPWYARRRLRLFRDETTLSATPALWPSIEKALADAEYLVLLASPEAAASRWVGREVEFWLTNKSPDRLLIALTGGNLAWSEDAGDFDRERSNALPPNLHGVYREEPLYVDLRWVDEADAIATSDPRFVDAAADLASAISGRAKDELVGAELQQRRRARQAILAGVSGIALTAVIAVAFAVFALVQRERAITQRNVAVSTELASQSEVLLDDDIALALLLAVASSQVGDGEMPAGRGALVGALEFSPHIHLLLHPARTVRHPVFSADASALALVDVQGALTIWDPRSGAPLPAPVEPLPRLASAAFSQDGRLLALGADDGTVLIWDRAGAELRTLGVAGAPVDGLAFAGGAGPTLASIGTDGVTRWDMATGARVSVAGPLTGEAALSEPNRRLSEEMLRRRLIEVAGNGSGVAVVAAADAARGALAWWADAEPAPVALGEHGAFVNDIAIAADGTQIATAGSDGRVVLWRVPSAGAAGGVGAVIDVRAPSADAVDFTPDGQLLVATSEGYPDSAGSVALWSTDGRSLASFAGHSTQVLSLAVSADGATAVSSAVDSTVIVWDLRYTQAFLPALIDVSAVAFSPDGTTLMTGTDRGEVYFWPMPSEIDEHRVRDRTPRWDPIAGHSDCRAFVPCVSAVAYDQSRAPRWAASGGSDGRVLLYDLSTDPPTARALARMDALVESLTFSPDGRQLAAGDAGGVIVAWAAESGELRLGPFDSGQRASGLDEKFTVEGSRLSSVAFTPDGALIVSGGRDGTLAFWDAESGLQVGSAMSTGQSVLAIAFSPDGRQLAAAGRGGIVDLFAVQAARGRGAAGGGGSSRSLTLGEPRQLPVGIGGAFTQVLDVAYSPDGSLIASTYDTGVLLWDVATGRRITRVLGGYRGLTFDVAFNPNGSTLLVAGNGAEPDAGTAVSGGAPGVDAGELGSVTLRGVSMSEMRSRACTIAQRSLTVGEWTRYIGTKVGRTCPDFPAEADRAVAAYADEGSGGEGAAPGAPTATAEAGR